MGQESYDLKGRKILVAEDSDDMWVLTERFLTRAGATIERARNGSEAVRKATQDRYDLVLMDIQMPIMDGLQATSLLRAKGFTSPILALTSQPHYGYAHQSEAAGCNAHMTKPINESGLIAKIADCCEMVDIEMSLGMI